MFAQQHVRGPLSGVVTSLEKKEKEKSIGDRQVEARLIRSPNLIHSSRRAHLWLRPTTNKVRDSLGQRAGATRVGFVVVVVVVVVVVCNTDGFPVGRWGAANKVGRVPGIVN